MGDILGALFGTSSTTTQETVPDEVSRAMNMERLNQLINLFQRGSLNQFAGAQPDLYTPTSLTGDLISTARNEILDRPLNYNNMMSLNDYRRSFDPVTNTYYGAANALTGTTGDALADAQRTYQGNLARGEDLYNRGIGRSYEDYITGVVGADQTYRRGSGDIDAAYNTAIQRGDYDLARTLNLNRSNVLTSLGISEADAQRSLATQDANRARALDLGIGTTGNYIDQIARPRLEQVMALQGLESGAALPAAIARATAEQAMPYLQGIENTYGTNQANTLNALMALRGELTGNKTALDAAASGAAAEGNVALGGQRLGQQGTLAAGYQNNVAQLAQALMANNITLEQAGIAANSALGQQLMQAQTALRSQQQQGITSLANTYGGNAASFASTLPGASQTLALLPTQAQAGRGAVLSALQPLADFPRQLSEADFLRRQGLFTTAYTGIPYTPGGTVMGGSATGNIFDQLGSTISSGVTGGQGGFSTLGTKT